MRNLPADLAISENGREHALTLDPQNDALRARRTIAFTQMLYIMIHPENQVAHDEALSTMVMAELGRYKADPETLVARAAPEAVRFINETEDSATAREWIAHVAKHSLTITVRALFPEDGFSAVARAKGRAFVEAQAVKALADLVFAGLALCRLYQMANHSALAIRGGASMNKVWYLLEKEPCINGPRNRRRMKELWSEFKHVSHLGAALYLLWEKRGADCGDTSMILRDLPLFLRVAKRFEDFGTRFVPGNMKIPDPVLDPDLIWRVPVNAAAGDADMPGGLSVKAQVLLSNYKAPQQLS